MDLIEIKLLRMVVTDSVEIAVRKNIKNIKEKIVLGRQNDGGVNFILTRSGQQD